MDQENDTWPRGTAGVVTDVPGRVPHRGTAAAAPSEASTLPVRPRTTLITAPLPYAGSCAAPAAAPPPCQPCRSSRARTPM